MVRAASVLGWAALVAGTAGCRHDCGSRGWLSSTGPRPVGRTTEACADPVGLGVPVSGGGIAPGSAGLLVPGSVGVGPAEELPLPAGSTIPPTSIPQAPPMVAPPPDPLLGTLPAPKTGVPVGNGK
ncbi:MAG: hypothetical protein K2X82_13850 [Gemmataceae bacterium]|nr:hypothetical protein [Gemmataceae bacterium]